MSQPGDIAPVSSPAEGGSLDLLPLTVRPVRARRPIEGWLLIPLVAFVGGATVIVASIRGTGPIGGVVATELASPLSSAQGAYIDANQARAIAETHLPTSAVYISAVPGAFADAYVTEGRDGPTSHDLSPVAQVWVVTFSQDVEICPPDGSACDMRPGTSRVVLDFVTGAFEFSSTVAPAP